MVDQAVYVLVADADPGLERQVRSELANLAVDVVAVRDGLAAHDALAKRGTPLALFADLALPRRDGFALVRGLRRVDTSRRVPAVLVTRFAKMIEAARDAADLGPVKAFMKPLTEGIIEQTVRAAMAAASRAPATVAPPPKLTNHPAPFAAVLPAPRVEKARVARVSEMCLVDDAPPDPELQRYMESIAKDFGVPIVIASVMTDTQQVYKAFSGLSGQLLAERSAPREWTFCQHVVQANAPLVVPDARHHPLFANHPMVQKGALIGYAGAPLVAPTGEVIGTLCLIDERPLEMGSDELGRLVRAARSIAGELEVRAAQKRSTHSPANLNVAEQAFPYLEATLQGLDVGVILLREDRRAVLANRAIGTLFGIDPRALHGKLREEIIETLAPSFAHHAEDVARLQVGLSGPYVIREEIELARPESRVVRWVGRPVPLPAGIGHLITMTDLTSDVPVLSQRWS